MMSRRFGEKLVIFQHISEAVEELDSARRLRPRCFYDSMLRKKIILSVRVDITRHCNLLRSIYEKCEVTA